MMKCKFAFHINPGAPALSGRSLLRPWVVLSLILFLFTARSETTLLYNAIVHTGSGETFTNGSVLIDGEKISVVLDGKTTQRFSSVHELIDLKGQHLYPGLIVMNTVMGL